jgi:hypothetical protein
MLLAGLMHHQGPLVGIDQGQAPGHDLIERRGSLAAAENQQVHRRFATGKTLCRRRQVIHLRTQRIAYPDATRQRIRKTAGNPPGKSGEHSVGQAGNRILFMNDQWATKQRCHQATGKTDVATHPENHIRSDPANLAPCLPAGGQ